MRQLVIGTAVTGSAAFALHRLARKARTMHDHCRQLTASREDPPPTESGCAC